MRKLVHLSISLICALLCGCRSVPNAPNSTSSTPSQTPTEAPRESMDEATPSSNVWNTNDVDISYVSRERKLISFTFDDAPASQIEHLLAVFASYNEANPDCKASASVFCNGYLFNSETPHVLSTALAMGWELGNHSYSHFDLTTLNASQIAEEIEKTDRLLEQVDGKRTHLFRPPFGRMNDTLREICPVPIVNWTIDTLDWAGTSVDDICQQVLTQKQDGSIVLMHDGYENTVEALKMLLPQLKAEGYQVLSVSAMAKMHDCALKQGSVYIRARKNGKS